MRYEAVYDLFFHPGETVEIRSYGLKGSNKAWEGWAGGAGVVYGYFNNAVAFGKAAETLEKAKAPGIYFTLNPVIPDLLARAANRVRAADAKSSLTADRDILCIRWLPVDLDPIRPSGISSTDKELAAAIRIRGRIAKWLERDLGWPTGIRACSGNGSHLVYRLPDFPNTEKTTGLVKDSLAAIAQKFKNKCVDVDLKVYNPARIWKLYGTTARKGDNTPDRPHRRSSVETDDATR